MNFTQDPSISPNLVSNATLSMPIASYVYFLAYSINAIVGLPINSYVFWLICAGKGCGIVAEFFSLNLTVCEILFCLTSLVFISAYNVPAVLYITYFSIALPTTGRPLINCVICIERYLAVLHPVSFLKYKPLKYRLACTAVIWLMVFVFGVLYAFILSSKHTYLFICIYLPLFSVLLFIELFCCLVILRALKYPGPGEKGKKKREASHMKKKAITVILIIAVTMFVQYSPVIVMGLFYDTMSEGEVLFSIGVAVFLMVGYVSPILYICRVRNL